MFAGTCSKLFKIIVCSAIVGSSTFATTRTAEAVAIDMSRYAAIAYSVSTGEWGYAWDQPSRYWAEREALSMVEADDAEIVGWVQGGWLVMAVGDNLAYGVDNTYGVGASAGPAVDAAQETCLKYCTKINTLIVLCSGNVDPQIIHRDRS